MQFAQKTSRICDEPRNIHKTSKLLIADASMYKNLKTCHSEARFIGRGICFFSTAPQQIHFGSPRDKLSRSAALRHDKLLFGFPSCPLWFKDFL
jgi:hypothetical protein